MTNKEMIDELKGVMAVLRADEKIVKLRMEITNVCHDLGVSPLALGKELEFLQQTASKVKKNCDLIRFMRDPNRHDFMGGKN